MLALSAVSFHSTVNSLVVLLFVKAYRNLLQNAFHKLLRRCHLIVTSVHDDMLFTSRTRQRCSNLTRFISYFTDANLSLHPCMTICFSPQGFRPTLTAALLQSVNMWLS
uniref:Secreted protein n=1 Tax=Steinernema glaseri TaxID=37863 RepID=A0A1I7YXW6_9BILA